MDQALGCPSEHSWAPVGNIGTVSNAAITTEQLAGWSRRFGDLVIKNKGELTELDSAIGESAEVWVMAPMIATIGEVRDFGHAARTAGLPSIGVMIETPAAVIEAEQIPTEVDFVSIGTNDLARYAFAADRHSASLASLNDPWQPALLRMIKMVPRAASASGKPVGPCGEAAADPVLALLLTGFGISSLSMAPGALAEVGRSVERTSLEVCQRAARAACEAASPDHAREAVRSVVDD
jgi:phosphoenolpyruvate-protein kinase (PTS system EI component)